MHTHYTFLLEVRDVPGVLVRVAQVFARRGCNIRSVQVHPQGDPDSPGNPRGSGDSGGSDGDGSPWSTMTLVAYDIPRAQQIQRQLEKLVDVDSVTVHEHAARGRHDSHSKRMDGHAAQAASQATTQPTTEAAK